MSYKQEYQRIVNQFIKKSFPELKNKEVRVVEFSTLIFWTDSFPINGFKRHYIFINKRVRYYKPIVKKANLCHELCHIVLDYKDKGFFKGFIHITKKFPSWAFNTSFSEKIETKTDKEVIKRGYAKNLYFARIEWEKMFSKRIIKWLKSRGYLFQKDIKNYAKNIGKW